MIKKIFFIIVLGCLIIVSGCHFFNQAQIELEAQRDAVIEEVEQTKDSLNKTVEQIEGVKAKIDDKVDKINKVVDSIDDVVE